MIFGNLFNRIHVNLNDIAVFGTFGTTHIVSSSDNYSLSDVSSGSYTLVCTVSDNLTLSDVASKIATLVGNVSEDYSLDDDTTNISTLTFTVSEDYSLEDISLAFLGIDGIIGISTTATTITINFITSS